MMGEVPGPIATMSYNRNFFGKHDAVWLNHTMRKMKHWSVGEVELMAAYVSKNNACQYCLGDHIEVAKNEMEESLIRSIMDDLDHAPVDDKMKAILKFLQKLTTSPSQMSKYDIDPLRSAGISDEAIEEAIHVCGVFSVINRLADSFDFELSSNPKKVGKFLFKNGYGMASVWG